MKFDQGVLSHYFLTDKKLMRCEMDDVSVLLTDKKISAPQQLVPLLEQVIASRKKLLIIAADGLESEVLAMLVLNKLRSGLNVVAVKAPGFGDNRKAILQDLAVLTGGELISEELGMKVEDVTLKQLGSAKKITVTQVWRCAVCALSLSLLTGCLCRVG